MAVPAPTPRAIVKAAVNVKTGLFRRTRDAKTRSRQGHLGTSAYLYWAAIRSRIPPEFPLRILRVKLGTNNQLFRFSVELSLLSCVHRPLSHSMHCAGTAAKGPMNIGTAMQGLLRITSPND